MLWKATLNQFLNYKKKGNLFYPATTCNHLQLLVNATATALGDGATALGRLIKSH